MTFAVLGWAAGVLGVVVLAWAIYRSQGMKAWREAAEGWRAQVEERSLQITTLEKKIDAQGGRIRELELLAPPMKDLIEVLSRQHDTMTTRLTEHELRAEQRHEKLLASYEALTTAITTMGHRIEGT